MSRRIFARVRRGPMDNTAVCIFPWEMRLLEHVHLNNVEAVSIEVMASQKEGVIKVEKLKIKHGLRGPDLQQQLEAMVYVDPEEDPANDPQAEFNRLIGVYGMDKDFPIPVVERVYGQFEEGGTFAAKLKEHAKERTPRPAHARLDDEAGGDAFSGMSREELRAACRERGIAFKATDSKEALAARLEPVAA